MAHLLDGYVQPLLLAMPFRKDREQDKVEPRNEVKKLMSCMYVLFMCFSYAYMHTYTLDKVGCEAHVMYVCVIHVCFLCIHAYTQIRRDRHIHIHTGS
jgi:hypothetical protein